MLDIFLKRLYDVNRDGGQVYIFARLRVLPKTNKHEEKNLSFKEDT